MYAAIVKHRSIHNTLNIKVKFLCYNVNAHESRARKINMKLFWKTTTTWNKKNESKSIELVFFETWKSNVLWTESLKCLIAQLKIVIYIYIFYLLIAQIPFKYGL